MNPENLQLEGLLLALYALLAAVKSKGLLTEQSPMRKVTGRARLFRLRPSRAG